MSGREDELREGLRAVRARIAAAEVAAGRPAGSAGLVVVTKTHPAADVRLLAGLGVADVGESREPEAGGKALATADLPLRRHQIGQVQTRKAGAVAAWADVVHSVDRPKLVAALSRAAVARGRELECLVQVDLDPVPPGERPDPGGAGGIGPRGGAPASEVPALAAAVAAAEGLVLRGVMAVAPRGADPAEAFALLRAVSEALRVEHPGAVEISAGMSGDVEAAVAAGSTLLRVGTAVLGSRPRMG